MNIPVRVRQGQNHPSLNDTVFKGMEFQKHALYHTVQRTIKDPKHNFLNRVQDIKHQLEDFEREIISRTKNSISPEDQANGKLIQHIPSDAQMINDSPIQFFNLIYEICRQMNLSKMVPVLSRANIYEKKHKIATEKVMPGIASTILSKQLDDVVKCAKSIHQRIQISLNSICRVQRSQQKSHKWRTLVKKMIKALTRLLIQNHLFIEEIGQNSTTM
jgi:hypothetical protein